MRKTSRQVHAQNRLLAERSSRYEPTHAQHWREIFQRTFAGIFDAVAAATSQQPLPLSSPSSIAATKVNESKLEAPAISPSFRL